MTKHAVIVGGGYTGTCAAIQLSRHAQRPLRITVIEQRTAVGQGLAYSATDPDHRLNAPDMVHFVTPEAQDALRRWYEDQGGAAFDAAADPGDGALFIRRGDFGRFLGEQFAAYQRDNPSGSEIVHRRRRAIDIDKDTGRYRIEFEAGEPIEADLVIVATSNERPAIPAPFTHLSEHPAFHADPWNKASIETIAYNAKILFVGTALTAADVIVSRLRQGQTGPMCALSRHGLRSTRRAITQGTYATAFWDRIERKTSLFTERHGPAPRLIDLLRALRADIRETTADGSPWQASFDDLRDSVWQIWPALPLAEKRRFIRHLRVWYDVHRFRLPPQLEAALDGAVASGQLRYRAANIVSANQDGSGIAVTFRPRHEEESATERFDAIVNCTGPEPRPDRTENPFLRALVSRGLARPHPVGIGFDVDDDCILIGAGKRHDPALRAYGPLTLGQFGDPQGTPFILCYICKTMPDIAVALAAD